MSEPFLSPEISKKACLLCGKNCKKKQSVNYPTKDGWSAFKDIALKWSVLDIPVHDPLHHFTDVYNKVKDVAEIEDYVGSRGISHSNCRISFRNRITRYERDYPVKNDNEPEEEGIVNTESEVCYIQ